MSSPEQNKFHNRNYRIFAFEGRRRGVKVCLVMIQGFQDIAWHTLRLPILR